MRRFNPDKELKKLNNGKRNKTVFGVLLLLLVVAVGSSYALYQVRSSKQIVYTTASPFYQKDVTLSVYIDGVKKVAPGSFPAKEDGKIFSKVVCENGGTGTFDNENWQLLLKTNKQDRCDVYFVTRWKDSSGANPPELYQGMIPITISDTGVLTVADVTAKWYSYDDHEWANAVLIDDKTNHNKYYNTDGTYKKGTTIPITDVLQMYVWIPRYKYKLFNAKSGENSSPQVIDIAFEGNGTGRSLGSNNGQWYTHPAFEFGNTELNGFWVGKFEPSDPGDPNGRVTNKITEITILPDKTSMTYKNVVTFFNAERDIEKESNKYNLDSNEVDTRPMRNSEWGAVAYLVSSKYGRYNSDGNAIESGAEIWINNTAQGTATSGTWAYGGTYTGCVGDTVSAAVKWNTEAGTVEKCDADKVWTKNGVKASTTGNVYGIYDMSGGTWEYTMGVTKTQDGTDIYYASSGLNKATMPDAKYYDLYDFSESNLTHERGHLGDATRETLASFGKNPGGWNGDLTDFPYVTSAGSWPWFIRGGYYGDGARTGVFAIGRANGNASWCISFRSVLSRA